LRAALELAPTELRIDAATLSGIPLYDADVEAAGIPPAASALEDRIAGAHGSLLVTPEYNQSLPGVFKNAIDWLSRPPQDMAQMFAGKPVGIIGATPGPGGTRLAQTAWLPVLRSLQLQPWHGKSPFVAGAAQVFDAAGKRVDAKIRRLLGDYLAGFSRFVRGRRRVIDTLPVRFDRAVGVVTGGEWAGAEQSARAEALPPPGGASWRTFRGPMQILRRRRR
jgi:chromate reductase, NAD(P)H dehydrogenase (quinone)